VLLLVSQSLSIKIIIHEQPQNTRNIMIHKTSFTSRINQLCLALFVLFGDIDISFANADMDVQKNYSSVPTTTAHPINESAPSAPAQSGVIIDFCKSCASGGCAYFSDVGLVAASPCTAFLYEQKYRTGVYSTVRDGVIDNCCCCCFAAILTRLKTAAQPNENYLTPASFIAPTCSFIMTLPVCAIELPLTICCGPALMPSFIPEEAKDICGDWAFPSWK
jgi:hypothetical protein